MQWIAYKEILIQKKSLSFEFFWDLIDMYVADII